MDVTSFILGFKKGAASGSGGGSVEGVHTVTFMSEDGSAVLYERLVVDGDDCANVVDRGLLDTPTKESTAQYNYTYSGWSLTSGGSADASALKSVTTDRTVYAAFTSSVRYYTITYYDSDGTKLPRTDTLPYGAMPSYRPEKDGYSFNGWEPALAIVTGDASYTAVWQEKVTFAGGSWADIAEISESGQAANYFAVGDTRSEIIGDKTVTLEIIGFNHDDLADGTGKAGITIWCKTAYKNVSLRQGAGGSQAQPWFTSALHTAEEAMFDDFSPELQSVVKEVNKKYLASARWDADVLTGAAKIWSLAAVTELNYSGSAYNSLGDAYEKFAGSSKTMGKTTTYTDIATGSNYWVRGVSNVNNSYVSTKGAVKGVSTTGSTSYAISPCFCI